MEIGVRLVKTPCNDKFTVNSIEGTLEVWNLQSHEEAYLKRVMHVGNWVPRYLNSQEARGKFWKQLFPAQENIAENDWLLREKKAFLDYMKGFDEILSLSLPVMQEFEQRINHRMGEYMGQLDRLTKQVSELEGIGRELTALMDSIKTQTPRKRGRST
jgi:hypothetical protein